MKKSYWFGLSLVIGLSVGALGADYYVAQNGQTPGDFKSWASAASNIQDAADAAALNDTVWVGPGHYVAMPNATNYLGLNVVYLNKPLVLRSSDGAASTVIDGEGTHRGIATYYPVQGTNPFVIDGFTISNCYSAAAGGGVRFDDTAPYGGKSCIVRNCVIQDNVSLESGGGIHAGIGNTSYLTLTVSNCVIRNNQATGANFGGGGIWKGDRGLVIVTDCLIASNTATSGGAMMLAYSRAQIDRCIIRDNRATSTSTIGSKGGGGLNGYVIGTSAPGQSWLRNSLLYNNTATRGGGILLGGDPDFFIQNCTVVSNTATTGGGIVLYDQWSGLQATNCIVYFNANSDLDIIKTATWPKLQCSFVCTSSTNNLTSNIGNTTNNPLFANFAAHDFRLTAGSPCFNTGTNQTWMIGTVDLDGNPRIDRLIGQVDMGCYEYVYQGALITIR